MNKSVDICAVFGGREYIDYKLFLDYVAKDDIKELAFGVNIDDDGNVEYKNFRTVKHGHWEEEDVEEAGAIYIHTRCSSCGEYVLYDAVGQEIESPYCPWCGAKMDEKDCC